MSFLRNVLHDLVEKKLWPVAAALVIALVAIPVALGGSSTPVEPVAAVPPGPSEGALGARDVARGKVVSLDEQAAGALVTGKERKGERRNPFVQHHVKKAETTDDVIAQAEAIVESTKDIVPGSIGGGGSADTGSGSGSTGGSTPASSGGGSAPAQKPAAKKPAAKPDEDDKFVVKVRFGEAGEQKTYPDLARLTPLPSSANPFLVFLGVKEDGRTAMFLVSSDAVPTGDGTCRPSDESCETLEVKAGDSEFLDLQTGTAGVVQYQLDLVSVKKVDAKSKAKAAAARVRESKAGREVLRAVVASDPDVLAGWQFSADLGLLVEKAVDAADGAVAHVPADVADAADGDATTAAPSLGTPTP